jgi:Tol biopolymer transport system component
LTDGYQGDLDPMFSPAGDRLVFSSSRDGNRHLWTARSDGTDARPLTFGLSQDERPAYSPDGREIAFASDRGGRHAIWVVAADGGSARKIVDAELTGGITWARDGRQIIYAAGAGEGPALWKVPLTGGGPSRVPTPSFASEPTMSPTRDVIAFIAVKRMASGAISEIGFVDSNGRASYPNVLHPSVNGFSNGMLAWSPDGRRIAVVEQSANNPTRIWLADPEHPQRIARLAELQGARVRGITWAPDGNAIVYGKHDWTSDIVLMQREP